MYSPIADESLLYQKTLRETRRFLPLSGLIRFVLTPLLTFIHTCASLLRPPKAIYMNSFID